MGFQVTGMIEWSQKSRPKKIPRASSKTPKKSLDQTLTPKKSHADFVARFCGLGTARHVCLIVLYSQNYVARALPILFNTPPPPKKKEKKIPTQIKLPKKILARFSTLKTIPESNISNPKKSFDHASHLKSRVPPPPSPFGTFLQNRTTIALPPPRSNLTPRPLFVACKCLILLVGNFKVYYSQMRIFVPTDFTPTCLLCEISR